MWYADGIGIVDRILTKIDMECRIDTGIGRIKMKDEERLELLKSLGLTPKTFAAEKQLYYKGILSRYEHVECDFLEMAPREPAVVLIRVNETVHGVALDYLKEMQPSQKEIQQLEKNRNQITLW